LLALAAKEKAKAESDKKERAESGKAENFAKDQDARVQFEMSFPQFLRLIRGERKQDENTLILKEAQHPVLEAIDMGFDLIVWLIGLFLSPDS
jgi:hypothetical protein